MKTINKAIILFFMLICVFNESKSQNSSLNESKYWVWRDRLLNDFMVPGYCKGCGIVFTKRGIENPGYSNVNNYQNNSIIATGGFDINDNGWEMGTYLVVLASEWRLLYNSGLPTDKTEREIYWELKTIERLDRDAEKYWTEHWQNALTLGWISDMGVYPNGSIDGFMIRDDIFEDFLYPSSNIPVNSSFTNDSYNKYLYLNQGHDAGGYLSGKYQQQNILTSDYNEGNPYLLLSEMYNGQQLSDQIHGGGARTFSAAMSGLHASDGTNCTNCSGPEEYSQDNYIGLLQGLVAVYKLVYSGVTVDGINLCNYSSGLIDRIIHSIRSNDSFNDNWVIDNPVTTLCVKGTEFHDFLLTGDHNCNAGGAEAGWTSSLFAKIHNSYTNTSNISGQIVSGAKIDNMLCILSTLTGYIPWSLDEDPEDVNAAIVYWLNHPEESGIHVTDDASNNLIYLDLLFSILHYPINNEDKTAYGWTYYESWLNNKICCLGCDSDHPWPSDNTNTIEANYLNQMALFNLLKIVKGETYTLGNNFDNNYYPGLSFGELTCLPVTNHVAKEIQSTATLSYVNMSNTGNNICFANVTYIAGEHIVLKPGFNVSEGCTFIAKIEPCDCKVRTGQYDIYNLPYDETDNNGNKNMATTNHQDDPNIIMEQSHILMEKPNKISNTIDTDTIDQLINIKIFPNPTKQFVSIQIPVNYSITLEVTNIYGQLVMSRMLTKAITEIDMSEYSKGTYFFKLHDQDNLLKFEKLIFQ